MQSAAVNETTQLLADPLVRSVSPKISNPDQVSKPPTPIPWRPLIIVCCLFGIQPLAYELVFPFVNQMIVEIGVVDDPEKVGFYSGFIESIFAFMSFLAIMPCSYLSDHYGRKPVVLFGTIGLGLSTSLFGLSRTFWAMVLTRCLAGATGGSWSALRTMMGELTDKSNQGKAFSWLMISYRLGQIIGHPVGGFLAHPERNFSWFRTPFWYAYPFSLPCFVAGGFSLTVVILGFFFLKETSKPKRLTPTHDGDNPSHQPPPNRPSLRSVLTPRIRSLFLNTFGFVLGAEMMFSLYPLFAFTPLESGGLGVNEATIGTHMAVRAINNILIMFLWDPLQRCVGTVRLYQISTAFWPLSFACFPLLAYVARNVEGSWIFNSLLLVFFSLWSLGTLGWTGTALMVNDEAPSADALAAINSVSQMATALPQAVAPAFATSLFAISLKSRLLGGNLIWAVMVAIGLATTVHSLILKETVHDWRDDRD